MELGGHDALERRDRHAGRVLRPPVVDRDDSAGGEHQACCLDIVPHEVVQVGAVDVYEPAGARVDVVQDLARGPLQHDGRIGDHPRVVRLERTARQFAVPASALRPVRVVVDELGAEQVADRERLPAPPVESDDHRARSRVLADLDQSPFSGRSSKTSNSRKSSAGNHPRIDR